MQILNHLQITLHDLGEGKNMLLALGDLCPLNHFLLVGPVACSTDESCAFHHNGRTVQTYQKQRTESLNIKINKQIVMNEVRGFFWEVLLSHPL